MNTVFWGNHTLGQLYVGRIKTVLQHHRQSLRMSITVENAELLAVKFGDSTLSPQLRRQLTPLTDWLLHAKAHGKMQKLQRRAYNEQVKSPGDFIILTMDFKEKGVLPIRHSQTSFEFYERGKYCVLDVVFVWSHGGNMNTRNFDLLLPTLNQDSACVILLWEEIMQFASTLFSCICCSSKQFKLWFDTGRHFLSKATVSFMLQQPRVKTLTFFLWKTR